MEKKKSSKESSEYEKLMKERALNTKKYVGNPQLSWEKKVECARINREAKLRLGQPPY